MQIEWIPTEKTLQRLVQLHHYHDKEGMSWRQAAKKVGMHFTYAFGLLRYEREVLNKQKEKKA